MGDPFVGISFRNDLTRYYGFNGSPLFSWYLTSVLDHLRIFRRNSC